MIKKWKKIYNPQNWEKKKKKKTSTEVCICVHSK